jgi:predicted small secreted protein
MPFEKESLTMKKKFVILSSLVTAILSLSACGNTANGVGKDFENWGRTIQDTF